MLQIRTITGHLLVYALALALPILLMSGLIGWAYILQEQSRIESLAERQASQMLLQVDNRLAAYRATLNVLAIDPLFHGDMSAVRARLAQIAVAPGVWFTVRDRQGRQLVNTNMPPDSPLPTFPGQGDPVVFDEAKPFTSNLIWAPVMRQWAVTLSVPIRDPGGTGEVRYALTIGVPALHFQRLLADIPEGWIATINDREHKILARSRGHEEWVGKPMAQRAKELTRDVPPGKGGHWRDIFSLEGTPVIGAYQRMPSTGWLVGIVALPEVYKAPRQSILLLGSILAVVSLLTATAFAFLMGRRITSAVQVLQTKATALREMRVIDVPKTSLDEVNAVAEIMRDTARVLLARQEQQTTMIQELNHRVKNTLATIQSISRMTIRNSADMAVFEQAFTARLMALSTTHNLLTESAWSGVELHELMAIELKPFQSSPRVTLDGPPVNLTSKIAVALGMAVHEMATNAAKYGAGQGDDGHIHVRWTVRDGVLNLDWRERSNRRIEPPTRQGFGSRLIQQTIGRELQGEVGLRYEASGLHATFTIPLDVNDRIAA